MNALLDFRPVAGNLQQFGITCNTTKGADMKRCPHPRFTMVLIAIALCSLVAVSAFAQVQSGNIFGKVQAKDGSVLPGVTVTLTGGGAPQTFVSDAQGSFRFINLSPGAYTLKAELAGYGTATRAGITVNVGRNADVTLTLNPSVSESITVTAEAPLLDIRKAGTAISVGKVELEKIPTSRDPWTILQQAPSVQVDRINVGGNQSGQQSVYIGKGSDATQNTWNVDGVNITDMGATGSTPLYFDFDSFEELQITTRGSDPPVVIWSSSNESKSKYSGEEPVAPMSVMLTPSTFHVFCVASEPLPMYTDCWPDWLPPTLIRST